MSFLQKLRKLLQGHISGFPFKTLRETFALLDKSNRYALFVNIASILVGALFYPALLIVLQWLLQIVTQHYQRGTGPISPESLLAVLLLLLLFFIQRLSSISRINASAILRQQSWLVVTKETMNKLLAVPYSLFENNDFQATYGLVTRESSFRLIVLVESLTSTMLSLIAMLGIVLTLLAIAPLLVLVLVMVSIPTIIVETRSGKAAVDLQSHFAQELLRMQFLSQLQIEAPSQRDLRVYHSTVVRDECFSLAESYLHDLKRLSWRFQGSRSITALIELLGVGLALAALFLLLELRQISLIDVGIFLPGMYLLLMNSQILSYHYHSLIESLGYVEKAFEFLHMPVPPSPNNPLASSLGASSTTRRSEIHEREYECPEMIRVEKLSFCYPQSQRQVLTDISYDFKRGVTAIVGPNGAGKSTLVKLLAGLIEPTVGSIKGVTRVQEEIPITALPKAVLFQDPSRFHLSIRQNVTMRHEKENGDEERINHALHAAGLWHLIESLPDGIDTVVGPGFGGFLDLSGGQWQRLALARLLYHDAPIVVLDEPSTHLDAEGERDIFEFCTQFAQKNIVIFTTHHRENIQHVDNVVVLKDGMIVERRELN